MRSRSPRSDRTYKPTTNFDRPPLQQPIADILAGIPETDWDTPMEALLWESPRDAARNVSESSCLSCRDNLRIVREGYQR